MRGHQGLDAHIGELAAETNRARENQRLTRDIQSAQVDARIGLRVAERDGASQGFREKLAPSQLAEQKAERPGRTPFDR